MRFRSIMDQAIGRRLPFAAALVMFMAPAAWPQSADLESLARQAVERSREVDLSAVIENHNAQLERGREGASAAALKRQRPATGKAADLFDLDLDALVKSPGPNPGSMLYIFVSFSMSDSLIKQYVQDAVRYNGRVVIGGLHNDSFKDTIAKVEEFVEADKYEGGRGGVLIDPKSFETFGVSVVPTIVLAKEMLVPCLDSDCRRDVPLHDRLTGSVSVEYALGQFSQEGDLPELARQRLEGPIDLAAMQEVSAER